MTRQTLQLTVAATLALLAACGSKEPPAGPGTTAATTQPEASPPTATPAESPPAKAAAPAPKPAAKPVARPAEKPVAPAPGPVEKSVAPAARPVVLTVPAGTALALSLNTALSSKTAKVGDAVTASLTEPVLVGDRIAIATGTTVAGSVIKVVSGSDKIGGTPTLAISFDRLELPGGTDVPISGEITQQGKSDTARDTVKIVGGTAAGAIIGDKVIKGKKGKFIGGLLGGAVGAAAAQKTGTEVKLAEGTALSIALDAPVEITK